MQVAASLRGVAQLGAVNCESHRRLCQDHGIKTSPTIKAVVPGSGKGSYKLYKGDPKSAKALSDWVVSLVPNHVTEVLDGDGLDKLLARCTGGGKKDASIERATWDVCLILVTDKASTPVSYKSLSK